MVPGDPDKVERVRDEVARVKDIMVTNIEALLERGERLDLLVDKTEQLSSNAVTFKQVRIAYILMHLIYGNIYIPRSAYLSYMIFIIMSYFLYSSLHIAGKQDTCQKNVVAKFQGKNISISMIILCKLLAGSFSRHIDY